MQGWFPNFTQAMGKVLSHMQNKQNPAWNFISTRRDLKSVSPFPVLKKRKSMSSEQGADSRTFSKPVLSGLLNQILGNPVEDSRHIQRYQLIHTPPMSEQNHLHHLRTHPMHCIIQAPTPKHKPLDSCRLAKASGCIHKSASDVIRGMSSKRNKPFQSAVASHREPAGRRHIKEAQQCFEAGLLLYCKQAAVGPIWWPGTLCSR